QKAAAEMRETHRFYDGLYMSKQLGPGRFISTAGPEALLMFLGPRLTRVSGLPDTAREKLAEKEGKVDAVDMAAAVRALVEAGQQGKDAREPSWTVLGRMIEDTAFVVIFESAQFYRRRLSPSPDEVKETTRPLLPLVAEHPYKNVVLVQGIDERRQAEVYRSLLEEVELVDVEATAEPALDMMAGVEAPGKVRRHAGWALPGPHLASLRRA